MVFGLLGLMSMWGIWGILGLIAFIWVLVDVINRKDLDTGMKVLWIIIALPFILGIIGAAIYYFIGKKKKK